ncbi:MAG: MFS transporter [Myxococcales bacterium]|nr:MAG: MFS transporter [Myxococcales bacterium]
MRRKKIKDRWQIAAISAISRRHFTGGETARGAGVDIGRYRWAGELNLSAEERKTFRFILAAASFTGLVEGLILLMPEVARNTLAADKTYISILTLMGATTQLLATYWSDYLDGLPDKSRTVLLAGFFGRYGLVFGALFSRIEYILPFYLLFVMTTPAVLAAQHSVVQANFRAAIRGKLYSYVVRIQMFFSLSAAVVAGFWLDANPQNYRWILMLAALGGFFEAFILSRATIAHPLPEVYARAQAMGDRGAVRRLIRPWRLLGRLFREDRQFFLFEVNFFIYGLGFMVMLPFLTLFFVNDLKLAYSQISLAKGAILQGAVILLAPWMGRLFDRQNPILYTSYVCLMIAVFPAMLVATALAQPAHPEWMIYIAYGLFSVGWTGLIIAWNLGAMFFAKSRDVSRYTGAHVTMVGLRGLLVLFVSAWLINVITPVTAFAVCLACWLLASLMLFLQWHRFYTKPLGEPGR